MNATRAVIGHYPYHDLLEYRYMDDVTGNLFSLFCPTSRRVLKMFVRLFRIEQVKASKKRYQELFANEKNGEMETKRVLDNVRMSKLQEILTIVSIECHRYERLELAILHNVVAFGT